MKDYINIYECKLALDPNNSKQNPESATEMTKIY